MAAIFAIIAISSQVVFAIVAIDVFAITANTSDMRSLQDEQRVWLAEQLAKRGRGARSALAEHLGIRNDAVTRMTNLDGKKEAREISFEELLGISEFFGADPPGLAAARQARKQAPDAPKVTMVPLVDTVPAGKLAAPMSQIADADLPRIAMVDIGHGDFIALTVRGDSMDRWSPDGSTILIDREDRELVSGRPYVFSVRGEVTYKMFRSNPPRLQPYSWNAAHEPRFVKTREDAEKYVVGRVKRTLLDL